MFYQLTCFTSSSATCLFRIITSSFSTQFLLKQEQTKLERTASDTLPVNLLQPQSHTQTETHTLDQAQRLPSACVCMLAYCTRKCVILMCESEWMGVEMSLLIFGKYRRSVCYAVKANVVSLKKVSSQVWIHSQTWIWKVWKKNAFFGFVHWKMWMQMDLI